MNLRWGGRNDILFLAERIRPSPGLLPEDPGERALMFGLAHEICGEWGFGWSRRLMLLHRTLADAPNPLPSALSVVAELGRRYGYTQAAGEAATGRVREILAMLSHHLSRQRERGIRFFVGEALSAVDVYWAAFAAMLEPLPDELCPMNATLRAGYTLDAPEARGAADPLLLEHRDFVYREYLELPVRM